VRSYELTGNGQLRVRNGALPGRRCSPYGELPAVC
jgi:hypothetical protein